MDNQHYILDDIISTEECLYLYHKLQYTNSWSLENISNLSSDKSEIHEPFLNLLVEKEGKIYHDFYAGYFQSLIFRLKQELKKQHNLELQNNIQKTDLVAQMQCFPNEYLHCENYQWSVRGFICPVWNIEKDEGFYVDGIRIAYKTARFVVYKSNLPYKDYFTSNVKLNNWRINLNIHFGKL